MPQVTSNKYNKQWSAELYREKSQEVPIKKLGDERHAHKYVKNSSQPNKLNMFRLCMILQTLLLIEPASWFVKSDPIGTSNPLISMLVARAEVLQQAIGQTEASTSASYPAMVVTRDSNINKTEPMIEASQKRPELLDDSLTKNSTNITGVNQPAGANLADSSESVPHLDEINTTTESDSIVSKLKPQLRKTKRQKHPKADWWSRFSVKQQAPNSQSDTKDSQPQWIFYDKNSRKRLQIPGDSSVKETYVPRRSIFDDLPTKRPIVYVEQPIKQNPILTIKKQLKAIRSLRKQLVTKSMRQLQQLDNRLIDSYKSCLKKKQPLYAGMLYRTRDFAARMAQDVKHENKILEAMTKQILVVLEEKIANRTIVKDYKKVSNLITDPSNQYDKAALIQEITADSDLPLTKIVKTQTDNSTQNRTLESIIDTSKVQEQLGGESSGQRSRDLEPTKTKSKPLRYTVSVNEVNLRRELDKIQALIVRVNDSSYELTSIVNEINHLFRLTLDYSGKKGSSPLGKVRLDKTAGQVEDLIAKGMLVQRGNRKMLRSPIRLFFEKYGKISAEGASSNNSAESASLSIDETEIKPLFEPDNLEYNEPADWDSE